VALGSRRGAGRPLRAAPTAEGRGRGGITSSDSHRYFNKDARQVFGNAGLQNKQKKNEKKGAMEKRKVEKMLATEFY
jgi:hypothetical protein